VLAILEGERRQTGVILLAGRAPVTRIPESASMPSPALNLDLERRLRATEPLAPRKADRVHQVDLTGNMEGYVWSINGVAWNKDVPPLPISKGERVELVIKNKTLMPQPMHLHGHEFQVGEIDGKLGSADDGGSGLAGPYFSLPASRPRNRRSPEAAHWRPRSSPADARLAACRSNSAGAAIPTRGRRNSLRLAVHRPCDAASHTSQAGSSSPRSQPA
jgi:FtsP/CotA-like multicopper oxidase with cupredoxin domain